MLLYVRNRTDCLIEHGDTLFFELCFAGSLSPFHSKKEECAMNLNLSIGPLVSLIAGILILVVPGC